MEIDAFSTMSAWQYELVQKAFTRWRGGVGQAARMSRCESVGAGWERENILTDTRVVY